MITIDLLNFNIGDKISKTQLKDLITYSKNKKSQYYSGDEYIINDTYQKGINWIGDFPYLKGVIIKNKPGKYIENDDELHYAFQAVQHKKTKQKTINKNSKANLSLINSKTLKYPLLYFCENGSEWKFLGKFVVKSINDKDVELTPFYDDSNVLVNLPFTEGNITIIQHMKYERNLSIIEKIKKEREWKCDICKNKMENLYEVKFIEAHHKIKISDFKNTHEIFESDIVLLCPNCHTATHYLMKDNYKYDEIKKKLQAKLSIVI